MTTYMDPVEGLDYIGILANGPDGLALARRKAARVTDGVTFHGDPSTRPRDVGANKRL